MRPLHEEVVIPLGNGQSGARCVGRVTCCAITFLKTAIYDTIKHLRLTGKPGGLDQWTRDGTLPIRRRGHAGRNASASPW